MGTFIGSLTSAASITLTNPIIPHSFYLRTMPLSIITIKRNISITQKFKFPHVCPWEVMKFFEVLDTSKSTSGDIPTKIIKMAKENICPYLTDCINAAIYKCTFPDELKKADVSAIFKKGNPSCRENYRPISILTAICKIYERSMGVQMNSYFKGILSALLSGFRKDIAPSMPYFVQRKLGKDALITIALLVLF